MSASTAIGMVSESLRNLLVGEMTLVPSINITILAPDESGGGNRRVNLFLYKVQENVFLKNQDLRVDPNGSGQLIPPPLSLNLYYLMTPYAQNDPQTGNATAHEIMGEAMRVFYENPIIPDPYLSSGIVGASEQIKVMLNTVDPEEISRVWSTFIRPFRTSVLYEVSVVQLDMLPGSAPAIPPRVRSIGVPDVRAPFSPPVVSSLSPLSGTAGSTVTFNGEHLDGWQAYVTVMGSMIASGQAITGESFDVTLPATLTSGFHEIRVDISHLHRRTFFFEVTA